MRIAHPPSTRTGKALWRVTGGSNDDDAPWLSATAPAIWPAAVALLSCAAAAALAEACRSGELKIHAAGGCVYTHQALSGAAGDAERPVLATAGNGASAVRTPDDPGRGPRYLEVWWSARRAYGQAFDGLIGR